MITTLSDLKELQALVLNNNEIQSIADLFTLQSLNTLVISHNELTSLDGLEKLKGLKKLSATHNRIAVLPTTSIHQGWGLQLTELRLSHNLLTSVPLCLKHAPKLKIVDVGHNQIFEWKYVEVLGTLECLIQLNLAGNPICDRDNYLTTIRELCPRVKILDGRKIVDDLRRRKKWKRVPAGEEATVRPNKRSERPSGDQESEEPSRKRSKVEIEKKEKLLPAPMVLRGRVSTGKRLQLDSDSEDEPMPKPAELPSKKPEPRATTPLLAPKEPSPKDAKPKQLEEEPGEAMKKRSSGVVSVTQVKKDAPKKGKVPVFSVEALLETDQSFGSAGESQW